MNFERITLQDIIIARSRIKKYIRHTPLEYNWEFSSLYESEIYLKLENLQITGSFKPRGTFNKLLKLKQKERESGVIAPSAGNHGIGLAYAAGLLKISAHVYILVGTDKGKVHALERFVLLLTFSIQLRKQGWQH